MDYCCQIIKVIYIRVLKILGTKTSQQQKETESVTKYLGPSPSFKFFKVTSFFISVLKAAACDQFIPIQLKKKNAFTFSLDRKRKEMFSKSASH